MAQGFSALVFRNAMADEAEATEENSDRVCLFITKRGARGRV